MSTVVEIQQAIEKLSPKDRAALTAWLESQEETVMSDREEAALLASLDRAAMDLDAGKGVPAAEVRSRLPKWATK